MPSKIPDFFRLPVFLFLALLLVGSGCGLIYKQNVQQGNALEQKDLDELYLGMNKRQVLFVLGSPSIHDPFHQQRWDYVQTFSRRGGKMVQRTVTLRFDQDDLLVEMIGADQTPAEPGAEAPDTSAAPDKAKTLTADAIQSAVKEVKVDKKADKAEPEIKGLGERTAQDRVPDEDKKPGQQTGAGDDAKPDGDGQ